VELKSLIEALGGTNASERLGIENKGGIDSPEAGVKGGASSDDPSIIRNMGNALWLKQFIDGGTVPRMDASNVIVMCRVKGGGLLPILHWFTVYKVNGEVWFSFNFDTAVVRLTRENLELYGVVQIREAKVVFEKGKGHLPSPPPSCEGMQFWRMVTGTDCLHHAWANAVGYKGKHLKLPKPTGGGQSFSVFFNMLPPGFAYRGINLGESGGPSSFNTLGTRLYAHANKAGPRKERKNTYKKLVCVQ
jgi:hypothetical protein